MGEYILKLAIVLPLICGLAWGSLMLWKRLYGGIPSWGQAERTIQVIDALSMGTNGRLVVVAFAGRNLLLSATRGQISLLAEAMPEPVDA